MARFVLGLVLLGSLLAVPAEAAFSETQRLQSFHPQVGEDFGSAVAVAGDTGVVCAPRRNLGNGNYGECIVYRLINGTWEPGAVLLPREPGTFGSSVALSGDRIVVGAPVWEGPLTGRAYVFRRVAPDSWVEEAMLSPWHGEDGPFGASVAIDGDVIAVGAPGEIDEAGDFTNP